MKRYFYIFIALTVLLSACTKAELCEDAEHPHRAGVRFAFDWANADDDKYAHQKPDSMLVLAKRIIGTWLTGCRVNSGCKNEADQGKGWYLLNGPSPQFDEDDNPIPVDGIDTPTDLFKVQAGLFKCIAINRDTTEFLYNEINEYAKGDLIGETTLRDLCVEYKRYNYRSPKLRNVIPGWTDYNIYGDAENYLQPDMAPVYYDSIAPVTISRGVEHLFTFKPILLTQNIDIRFHIQKKVDVAPFLIETVYAEISGIPYRLNLSTDRFDIRNTAKMMFTCNLCNENGQTISDTETNEYLLCHGNIDVLSLINAPNTHTLRGPGIMQLMIRIKGRKTIRVKVNLRNAILEANLYEATEDGEWARRRKEHGVLDIKTNLVIDEEAVLPSDDGGMEVWTQAGLDDIVVDT